MVANAAEQLLIVENAISIRSLHRASERTTYKRQVKDPEEAGAVQTESAESDTELVHGVAVSADCAACAPRLSGRSADIESAQTDFVGNGCWASTACARPPDSAKTARLLVINPSQVFQRYLNHLTYQHSLETKKGLIRGNNKCTDMEEVYGPRPKRDMITQSATPINAAPDIANGHAPELQKH